MWPSGADLVTWTAEQTGWFWCCHVIHWAGPVSPGNHLVWMERRSEDLRKWAVRMWTKLSWINTESSQWILYKWCWIVKMYYMIVRCWVSDLVFHLVLQLCMQLWKKVISFLYCYLAFVYPCLLALVLVPYTRTTCTMLGSCSPPEEAQHIPLPDHIVPQKVSIFILTAIWMWDLTFVMPLSDLSQRTICWSACSVLPRDIWCTLLLCLCFSVTVIVCIPHHLPTCLKLCSVFRYVSSSPTLPSHLFLSLMCNLVHVPYFCPSPTTMFQAVVSGLACIQYLNNLHILLLKKWCLKVVEYSFTHKVLALTVELEAAEVHTRSRSSYSS